MLRPLRLLCALLITPCALAGPATAPATQPASPVGLWAMESTSQSFNVQTHAYDFNVEHWYLFFGAAGDVYYDVPRGGAAKFDWAGMKKDKPFMCGTWKRDGLTFRLDRPNAPSDYLKAPQFATIAADALTVGGSKYLWVKPLTEGQALDGTFGINTRNNVGNVQGGTSGFVTGSHAVRFTADGHFVKRGITAFTVSRNGNPDVNATGRLADKQVAGAYRVTGPYTVECKETDGTVETFTVFAWPGAEQTLLCLDGGLYTKSK